ncbi:hypothetical protein LOTGIDRAFT_232477 [Lottia gigantea]|uniref:Methyltransferase type 11 domain-containing protein n=1 Tax=Lottia gigantea TaxID=225164 RepID=V4BYL7_LOTGI|nr:hypothetical protein LOTGIDRAFT_232477 [Lottia gigantea]ESO94234.1 hypothetical protein LOTGIDRAFT_232477 [Lottia gigantea]
MENTKAFDIYKDFEKRKAMTKEEMLSKLNEWAKSGKYEKDMLVANWKPQKTACEVITNYYNPDRDEIRIIDVASGTGLVGMELLKLGFRNVDALDPSEEMMKVAKERKIYQNHFTEYFDGTRLACIETDTYDAAFVVGGFSVGYMPTNALFELIRIAKIGGLLILSVWEGFDEMIDEYRDRFFPLTQKMEKNGELTLLREDVIPKPDKEPNGLRLVYRVHVSESSFSHLKALQNCNEF